MVAVAAIRVPTQACTVHVRVFTVAVVYQAVGVAPVLQAPRHIIRMVIAMIIANISLISSSSLSLISSRAAPVATPPHPHLQLLRHQLLAAHRAAALRAIIAMAATTINCNCSSRLLPYQAIIIRIITTRIIITLCLASSLIMATTLVMVTLKHLLFLVPTRLHPQIQLADMRMPHRAMAIPVVTAAAVPQGMVAAIIDHMLVPTRAAMTMA